MVGSNTPITAPAIVPSIVLLGDTLGIILCLPISLPIKKANESVIKIIIMRHATC